MVWLVAADGGGTEWRRRLLGFVVRAPPEKVAAATKLGFFMVDLATQIGFDGGCGVSRQQQQQQPITEPLDRGCKQWWFGFNHNQRETIFASN